MAARKPNLDSGAGRLGRSRLLFSESISSTPEQINPLVECVLERLGSLIGVDGHREAVDLALREALVNAVVHGNKMNPAARVHVECFQLPKRQLLLVVRDEGQGFNVEEVEDPTLPQNLERATGRGIFLIRQFMDEVDFSAGGREIRMKKKC